MNILLLNSKIPFPIENGANLRMYNIFNRLKNNHRVYLLCFISNKSEEKYLKDARDIFEDIELVFIKSNRKTRYQKFTKLLRIFRWDFLFSGNINLSYRNLFQEKIYKIIKNHSIDVMHVHLAGMAHLCYDVKIAPKLLDIPDCLSLTKERSIELNYFNKISIYYWYEKLLLYKSIQFEKKITNYFNICTTVSESDSNYYKKINPKVLLKVIPNGVDLQYFNQKYLLNDMVPSVIFWGSMDFAPNIDAVCYFYNEIFPEIRKHYDKITFIIAGSSPVEKIIALSDDPDVIVTGFVDDIRPWIQKASVCITPMRIGSGIKNKILEAMAMNKPVVSTTLGGGGINLIDGENILLADDKYTFAEAVKKLIDDKSLRDKISLNGRKLVEKDHNWSSISIEYYNAYTKILSESKEKNPCS